MAVQPYQSPYVDYGTQILSEQEKLRRYLEEMRRKRDPLAAEANRSLAGETAQLKQQQEYANMLRSSKTPGVKQVGNVAAMNIWEGAENALNRALGGYLSGQNRQGYEDLDEARTGIATAKTDLETLDRDMETDLSQMSATIKALRDAEAAQNDRMSREGVAGANLGATMRGQDMTADTAAASLAAQNLRDRTSQPFVGPNQEVIYRTMEGGMEYVPVLDENGAPVMDEMGNPQLRYVPAPEGFQPLSSTAPEQSFAGADKVAARQAADREREVMASLNQAPAGARQMNRLLTNPHLNRMGMLDIEGRAAADFGVGPEAGEIKAFFRDLASSKLGGLIPDVAAAKLTPVSNTDIDLLSEKYANAQGQPEELFNYYGTDYRDVMERKFNEAIAAGNSTPEARDAWMNQQATDILDAARNYGLKGQQLITVTGLPREVVIDYLRRVKEEEDAANR